MGESKLIRKGTGSVIKSIQRGTKSGLGTVTITEIDSDSAVLLFKVRSGLANVGTGMVAGEITNDTTINFTAFDSDATVVIDWQVIEYNGVKSKQTGITSVTAGQTLDVTINSVDTDKSMLVFYVRWDNASGSANTDIFYMSQSAELLNSTTLRLYETFNNYTMQFYWTVLEFR